MSETTLDERTRELLDEAALVGDDVDSKVLNLLEAEYLRRLSQYQRVDHLLSQKYKMTFNQFHQRRIVEQLDFSLDSERDAMDWEAAISGIKTVQKKLKKLRQYSREGH
jgi:hypothetical protein